MTDVRRCRENDLQAACALARASFEELRGVYHPTAAARAIARTKHRRLVAFEGRDLVGTVEYRIDGRTLRLRGLAVHRDARRKGIARSFVDALAGIARERKCRSLRLFTIRETGNEVVFRKLGFVTVASRIPVDFESPNGGQVTELEMERTVSGAKRDWEHLAAARGSAGLVRALAGHRGLAPDLCRSLRAITAGTQDFALRICRRAGKTLGHPVPALPVRVPRATDRTDPAWYRTRARGGSVRLALLRGFKRLAVSELPLLEAHLGRRESPMFRLPAKRRWDAALPKGGVPAAQFRRAVKRWVHLLVAKATWLSLRLAEVAVTSTGDPSLAVETLAVCAAVAARPRLYDPFNTFAAFLEAFHRMAEAGPKPLATVLAGGGGSIFRRIALEAGAGKRWRSLRARVLCREGLRGR